MQTHLFFAYTFWLMHTHIHCLRHTCLRHTCMHTYTVTHALVTHACTHVLMRSKKWLLLNFVYHAWLTNGETHKAGIFLFNLLESHNLKHLVNEVTSYRPPDGQGLPSSTGQSSLLDLIITNRPDLFEAPMTHPPSWIIRPQRYSLCSQKQEQPKQKRTRILWNLKSRHPCISPWPSQRRLAPCNRQLAKLLSGNEVRGVMVLPATTLDTSQQG